MSTRASTTTNTQQQEPNTQSSCPVPHNQRTVQLLQSQQNQLNNQSLHNQQHDQQHHQQHQQQHNLIGDIFPVDDVKPQPNQSMPLDTHSIPSTIPRAHSDTEQQRIQNQTGTTWHYPSQQRFYNAMIRKGYNPNVYDVPYIVAIHNSVNEKAWSHVLEFESLHYNTCQQPKLLKFKGRPNDTSLKAYLRHTLLGSVKPFDRHDWTVDRCGKQVEYVIDFYSGKQDNNHIHDNSNNNNNDNPGIYIDVRPKPSAGGFYDIARLKLKKFFEIS